MQHEARAQPGLPVHALVVVYGYSNGPCISMIMPSGVSRPWWLFPWVFFAPLYCTRYAKPA